MQDFHLDVTDLRRFRRMWFAIFMVMLGGWTMPSARAHKASDAYLQVSPQGQLLAVRWEVALRDLQAAMPLDANDDGRITWGEVKARRLELQAYMMSRLKLQRGPHAAPCTLRAVDEARSAEPLTRRADGTYYVLRLSGTCPGPAAQWHITYRLLQEIDPTHRGLLVWKGASPVPTSLVPDGRLIRLPHASEAISMMDAPTRPGLAVGAPPVWRASYVPDLTPPPEPAPAVAASAWQMVRDGIHHILIGTDHVLFLVCLLLPAVLLRPAFGSARAQPVPRARDAFLPLLGTITMFTVAHSITLTMAGLGWVQLSSRIVEPAIALTIALAAIDNIRPIFQGRRHVFTFLFGLVHGFGFAGVLAELNLPSTGLVWALLQFNIGVELGQMLIVLPVLAVLWPLRHWSAYSRVVMPLASGVAIVMALGWWVERVFDLGFMPV